MSDQWGGPGWWIGGDGQWYPPRDAAPVRRKAHGDRDGGSESADTEPQGLFRQPAPIRPRKAVADDAPLFVEDAAAPEPAVSPPARPEPVVPQRAAQEAVVSPPAPPEPVVSPPVAQEPAVQDVAPAPLVVEEIDLTDAVAPVARGVSSQDAEETQLESSDWPVIDLRADIQAKTGAVAQSSEPSPGWLEGARKGSHDNGSSAAAAPPPVTQPAPAPPADELRATEFGAATSGTESGGGHTGADIGFLTGGRPVSPPASNPGRGRSEVSAMLEGPPGAAHTGQPAAPQGQVSPAAPQGPNPVAPQAPSNSAAPQPAAPSTRQPTAPSASGVRPGQLSLSDSQSVQRIPAKEVVPVPRPYVDDHSRNRTGFALLAVATILAVLSGLLGALWLRERSANADLQNQLDSVPVTAEVEFDGSDDEELLAEIEALVEQNQILDQQLADMSALVQELPVGRITEIDVPFNPVFADEADGRLIAVADDGEFVVWADGVDEPITDAGTVGGSPTGLFATANRAFVSTDATRVAVLPLANDNELFFVEYGPARFLAEEQRHYWTFNQEQGEIAQLRKTNGEVTNTVSLPTPVVDLTTGAGSVWALGEDGLVYRVNTADLTVQSLNVGESLVSITAGPDSLWTLSGADGALRRVDPVSGEVLVTVPVGRDPIDATFAGNSVWVALRSGESLIEVDTRTSAVISRTTLPDVPTALHRGESGVFVTMDGAVPLVQVASLIGPESDDEGADAESDG